MSNLNISSYKYIAEYILERCNRITQFIYPSGILSKV